MLAKTIQPERLARVVHFSVGAKFDVAVLRRPFGHVGVKAFSIFHHGCEQQQIAALLQFSLEPPPQFIARLSLDRNFALRAILRAQSRKQQADEMINLGHRRHGALAAATGIALLDADRRRQTGDQIHVGPRKLFYELPRIDVHRIKKAPLPFGKNQIKRERAFARATDAGDDDELVAGNFQRDVLEVVLARAAY